MNQAKIDAILALKDAEGRISAQALIDAAKDPEHPHHESFEWDDTKAGNQFRLGQSRALIRQVQAVDYETIVTREVHLPPSYAMTPYFIRDPEKLEGEPGYRALTEIRKDPDLARTAAVRELTVAAAHLRRARSIAMALGFGEQIDELTTQVVGIRERLDSVQEDQPMQPVDPEHEPTQPEA